MGSLTISNYGVRRGEVRLLESASMAIKASEVHILRGANGVGKSSLLLSLMGDANLISSGELMMNGQDISHLSMPERARAGLFISFQDLPSFPGITIGALARFAFEARFGEQGAPQFFQKLRETFADLSLEDSFMDREVGVGLSGGEKKRLELLLMLLMQPEVALLDELDAGLDQVGQGLLQKAVASAQARGTSFLIVTHQEDFAQRLKPNRVWQQVATRIG